MVKYLNTSILLLYIVASEAIKIVATITTWFNQIIVSSTQINE